MHEEDIKVSSAQPASGAFAGFADRQRRWSYKVLIRTTLNTGNREQGSLEKHSPAFKLTRQAKPNHS